MTVEAANRPLVDQAVATANVLRARPWRWFTAADVRWRARPYRPMPLRTVRRRLENLADVGLAERSADLTPRGGDCFRWAPESGVIVDAFAESAQAAGLLLEEPGEEPSEHCGEPLGPPRTDGARRCPACHELF